VPILLVPRSGGECMPRVCTPNCMGSPVLKIAVTGAGFMSDAYDLFIFNLVLVILQFDRPDLFASSGVKGTLATIVLIGSVLGQLFFGVMADRIGRRIGFIVTLALVTLGALLSATASDVRRNAPPSPFPSLLCHCPALPHAALRCAALRCAALGADRFDDAHRLAVHLARNYGLWNRRRMYECRALRCAALRCAVPCRSDEVRCGGGGGGGGGGAAQTLCRRQ
jgi:hypothetical protein